MPEVIGLFLRSADNAFQRRLQEVGLREASRHGFELKVQAAQFDSAQQVSQLREAIKTAATTNLVAILVSGVRDLDLAPVAHEAAAAGLDFALLNEAAFIDEVRAQHPDRTVFSVACDPVEIGRIQAEQVRALLAPKGRVLCVKGLQHNIAAGLRFEGLAQGLGGDYAIVELNADWTSEGARRTLESWLTGIVSQADLPEAFVAQNDEMALGVRQALRDCESKSDWPIAAAPIVGCDGAETFGQRLVREGRLRATVIMPPGAGVAIDWIARKRRDGESPPGHVLLAVASFPALSRLKR